LVVSSAYTSGMTTQQKDERQLTLRLPIEMHAKVKDIAEKERRSIHAQLVQFVDNGIERWDKEHESAQ